MSSGPNFDGIAPYYELLQNLVFGNHLRSAQEFYLNQLDSPKHIMILGGGTGKILSTLLRDHPKAQITYLEASANMIALAKAKIPADTPNIRFIQGTEMEIRDQKINYDVVLTPFILDVYTPDKLKDTTQIIFDFLKAGGFWIQTDFYVDRHSPLWQKLLIKIMYRFFANTACLENKKLQDFNVLFERLAVRKLGQQRFYCQMVHTYLYKKV